MGLLNSFWFIWWWKCIPLHPPHNGFGSPALYYFPFPMSYYCVLYGRTKARRLHWNGHELSKSHFPYSVCYFFFLNIYTCKQLHIILHKFNMCDHITPVFLMQFLFEFSFSLPIYSSLNLHYLLIDTKSSMLTTYLHMLSCYSLCSCVHK